MKRIWASLLALALACGLSGVALGQVVGPATTQVPVVPNTGAYSAGQCLGGVLSVSRMFRPGAEGGTVLTSIEMVDPAAQSAANDVVAFFVFNAKPTGTYTDHANCNVAAADQPYLVGYAAFVAGSCAQDQTPATTVCEITPNLPLTAATIPVVSSNLWIVPIVRATPTYGTTTLYFNFSATPYSGS